MARLPGAEWRPLPESGRQGSFTKTQIIYHSIVGSAEGAYGFFLRSTSLESTFIVRKKPKDGVLTIQLLDSSERADANSTANERAISVETEDNGNPNTDPWTAAQLDELVRIGVWACKTHGIPAQRCPAHNKPGIGYHSMFGAPSPWTPARGKTCPGTIRIQQFNDVLLPGIVAGVAAPEEDIVTEDDINRIAAAVAVAMTPAFELRDEVWWGPTLVAAQDANADAATQAARADAKVQEVRETKA